MIQKRLEEMFPEAKSVLRLGRLMYVFFEEYQLCVDPRHPERPWANGCWTQSLEREEARERADQLRRASDQMDLIARTFS